MSDGEHEILNPWSILAFFAGALIVGCIGVTALISWGLFQ